MLRLIGALAVMSILAMGVAWAIQNIQLKSKKTTRRKTK